MRYLSPLLDGFLVNPEMPHDLRKTTLFAALDGAHHDALNGIPADPQATCNYRNRHLQK